MSQSLEVRSGTTAHGAPGAAAVAPDQAAVVHTAPMAVMPPSGPVGHVRGTGKVLLLGLVTLGIYQLVWLYSAHEEMKRHTREGMGGGLAVLLALLCGLVTIFLLPSEVGRLYERRGQTAPVSAATALWCLIPVVGSFVWLVKTNGALNDYWRGLGAH